LVKLRDKTEEVMDKQSGDDSHNGDDDSHDAGMPYLSRGLSDFDEIWHAVRPS